MTPHVTSLELSKTLRDLGVKQESQFYWTTNNVNFTDDKCTWILEPVSETYDRKISAFLASELGELLPFCLDHQEYEIVYLVCDKAKDWWHCSYQDIDGNEMGGSRQTSDTLPEAMGKMLAHLLQEKLITL